MLDISRLSTAYLERALPLLVDITDLVQGAPAAGAIVRDAVEAAGPDPRRRALALALASELGFGIPGERRAAAIEAIGCAEAVGPAAASALHRALINLAAIKVCAAEGLDAGLLDRAAGLESDLPGLRLYGAADLHRGLWSRFVEDLDTARAALQRSIARAREAGDDLLLCTFLSYLAATEQLAGDNAAAAAALDAAAAWHDWPPSPWVLGPRCELLIQPATWIACCASPTSTCPKIIPFRSPCATAGPTCGGS